MKCTHDQMEYALAITRICDVIVHGIIALNFVFFFFGFKFKYRNRNDYISPISFLLIFLLHHSE